MVDDDVVEVVDDDVVEVVDDDSHVLLNFFSLYPHLRLLITTGLHGPTLLEPLAATSLTSVKWPLYKEQSST